MPIPNVFPINQGQSKEGRDLVENMNEIRRRFALLKVQACPKRHKVVATVDGKPFHVGFKDDGGFKFVAEA